MRMNGGLLQNIVSVLFRCAGLSATILIAIAVKAEIIETTQLAGFGQPKYEQDFPYFDYVNPKAPKYGKITHGVVGTFDNFNRYALRGVAAQMTGELYDSLMFSPSDEIESHYPLIAQKVRYSDDYTWLEIELNPQARFHDGKPIRAQDVEFTFQKFMQEGVPQYRVYYKDIQSVTALSEHKVRIEMKQANREQLFSFASSTRVLPQHFWQDKSLSEPLITPPIGSGPYQISDYKMGQSVTYQRVKDYWAQDLPVNIGRHNFLTIQYDYYRDDTIMLEAFKAGEFDLRQESQAKFWATAYTGTHFDKGWIIKEEMTHQSPAASQGFVFNTQKALFKDARVREALSYALDFEWMNKNMFYNQYQRTRSYFQNTAYEAKGQPDAAQLAVLTSLPGSIPERALTTEFQPPITDGSGRIRPQLRQAFALLEQAGWHLQNQIMTNKITGEPLQFELLIYSPTVERIAIALQKNLKLLGVQMHIRNVDTTQYIKRLRDRDFDMVSASYAANAYPNPNLLIMWHSNYIDSTYNTAGVKDVAIDALLERIIENQEQPEQLLILGRALDRLLQWNFYMIPQWHSTLYRVASWDKFERPSVMPLYDLGLDTWWISQQKAQKLPLKRQ